MAGKFQNINTNQSMSNQIVKNNATSLRENIINSVSNSMINRITDNPLQFFNTMNMTKVTFYNIDADETTLDEVMENANNLIGPSSGLRFDKINNCILYGLPNELGINININEFGTEADTIEGEAVLAPNTFKPYQESYFTIDYLETSKKLWFRVNTVNIDTFPNGSNYYKISWHLESVGSDITPQVVKEFNYIAENVGTGNSVLVDTETMSLINMETELVSLLQKFYYEMFFMQSVQTFVFNYGMYGYYFYDPFMINFAIRNNLLSYDGERYVHVSQPAVTPPEFNIDYNHTIYHKIENIQSNMCYLDAYGLLVQDPMSLLSQRIEPYYSITFRDDDGNHMAGPFLEKIQYFDTDLINLIPGANPFNTVEEYTCYCADILQNLDKSKSYYQIIYTYLNGGTITSSMIEQINNINFTPCKELYFAIPILIYIIKNTINNISV